MDDTGALVQDVPLLEVDASPDGTNLVLSGYDFSVFTGTAISGADQTAIQALFTGTGMDIGYDKAALDDILVGVDIAGATVASGTDYMGSAGFARVNEPLASDPGRFATKYQGAEHIWRVKAFDCGGVAAANQPQDTVQLGIKQMFAFFGSTSFLTAPFATGGTSDLENRPIRRVYNTPETGYFAGASNLFRWSSWPGAFPTGQFEWYHLDPAANTAPVQHADFGYGAPVQLVVSGQAATLAPDLIPPAAADEYLTAVQVQSENGMQAGFMRLYQQPRYDNGGSNWLTEQISNQFLQGTLQNNFQDIRVTTNDTDTSQGGSSVWTETSATYQVDETGGGAVVTNPAGETWTPNAKHINEDYTLTLTTEWTGPTNFTQVDSGQIRISRTF